MLSQVAAKRVQGTEEESIARLRVLIHEISGISLHERKDALIRARLSKRLRILGLSNFQEYMIRLGNDPSGSEMAFLLDAISTHVTSFYREANHFPLLRKTSREWLKEGKRKFLIWSAGCSTGEEPFTIAMELFDELQNTGVEIKILATDLATSSLESCQKAEYDERILKTVPQIMRKKYFNLSRKIEPVSYTVKPQIRELVTVRRFNLNTFPYPLKGPFDCIFCRNVMIYFNRDTRIRILSEFSRLLSPDGLMFIGHSESLTGITSDLVRVASSVYRKR